MEFKYIVRDEPQNIEKERPQGTLIGNERYRCMDAKFDGEYYHFAMASLNEKAFLYVRQKDKNGPMEVIKSFSDSDSIGQFWKFKNFDKKEIR